MKVLTNIASVLAEIIEAADLVLFGRRLTADDVRQDAPRSWMNEKAQPARRRRDEGWRPIRPGSATVYRAGKDQTGNVVSWDVANSVGQLSQSGNAALTDEDILACEGRGIDISAAAMYKPLFAAGMSAQAAFNESPDGYSYRRVQDVWAAFNEAQGTSKPLPRMRRAAKRKS